MGHDRRPRSPGAKFLEISGACSRRVNLAPVLWREPNLALVGAGPTAEEPAELVADKGYHSRDGLKDLEGGPWKSRIAEKKRSDVSRWHGDRKSTRLNSSHANISYAVFCLKKKKPDTLLDRT